MHMMQKNYTEELALRYSQLAPVWTEKIRRLGFCRAYDDLFIRLGSRLPLFGESDPKKVLDMGIGSDDLSHSLVKLFPNQINLTGVDISQAMLHQSEYTK
ncbi:MAG: hypothetical protein GF372_13390 [Candidatus Marinimicrobia bacterium]|nr:hypothetical protein [Candidatus Neomarinimicrobiota bacterium]